MFPPRLLTANCGHCKNCRQLPARAAWEIAIDAVARADDRAEAVEGGKLSVQCEFKCRSTAVGATKYGGPVKISVTALNEGGLGRIAVVAVQLGAKVVEDLVITRWRDSEYRTRNANTLWFRAASIVLRKGMMKISGRLPAIPHRCSQEVDTVEFIAGRYETGSTNRPPVTSSPQSFITQLNQIRWKMTSGRTGGKTLWA